MEMSLQLSLEQVRRLAPDEQSLSSARALLPLRFWSDLGFSPEAIWGRCRGSATYEVKIDLNDLGLSCNCPSRKRPCRHSLGLLMLFATAIDSIPEGSPPEWVQAWLDRRKARKSKSGNTGVQANRPVDQQARQKRMARREDRIAEGITLLERWLEDLIRNGLAAVELHGPTMWEDQARRLVDAQAPGLAARLRSIAEIPGSGADWPSRLLAALGQLQLLLLAYQRIDLLPPDLQSEVRQLIGWNLQLSDLREQGERVEDDWIVLGQREEEEDRLRLQRTWLVGKASRRQGLILQFAPGLQPFAEAFIPGTVETGTLVFYPGTSRLRARFAERAGEPVPFRGSPPSLASINVLLDDYADRLAQQPWLSTVGALLEAVTLVPASGKWLVRDRDGRALPLSSSSTWELLAVTGGEPFDLFGEWNGFSFHPLAHLAQGIYQAI
jgi:hypothetical protein